MSRHANGEGSIFRRADGRYAATYYAESTAGVRRRFWIYGRTRREVERKLQEQLRITRRGVRIPEQSWTVRAYLEHWLTDVVALKNRPSTFELYRGVVVNHLTPALGRIRLVSLSPSDVQQLINAKQAGGASVRTLHAIRSVLRTALSRAEREEVVMRNVAKLVELPPWHRKTIRPWTPDEAKRFLAAARNHRWYSAYLTLLTYGLRRGEVLGLTWSHVDWATGVLYIEQQLQRQDGELRLVPLKTETGRRALPMLPHIGAAISADLGGERAGLVFRSEANTAIDPKNFVRSFKALSREAGVPVIALHHVRHTTATMLKDLNVPAVDAQRILGHAHVTTTQQLYQHGDAFRHTPALSQIEALLAGDVSGDVAVKSAVKSIYFRGQSPLVKALTSGGPGGTRTLDTLLKSLPLQPGTQLTASVFQRARTLAYTYVLGGVAVEHCCQGSDGHVAHPLSQAVKKAS